MNKLVLYGDSEPLDIVATVNKLLKKHGLWFEDVTEEGGDSVEFELKEHCEECDGPHGETALCPSNDFLKVY